MRVPRVVGWLVGALGCTPLGVWVYEDPRVTVSRVRVAADSQTARPVLVALDVRNPNDYIVSATRVELQLLLDDTPIGRFDEDRSVSLPKGTAEVAVPLVIERGTGASRLQAFNSGVHRFSVQGRATFATPVGKRKVRFVQVGEMTFGPQASPPSAPAARDSSR
jgi:LEA14-like dessication related protein